MFKAILIAILVVSCCTPVFAGQGGVIPAKETVVISTIDQLHEACAKERDPAYKGSKNVVVMGNIKRLPQNCFRESGGGNGPDDSKK